MTMTRDNSQEPEGADLHSAPMHSLYELTRLRNLRSNANINGNGGGKQKFNLLENDFISRGSVSLIEAENLFAFYNLTMNHFLWGGVTLVHPDLNSVRRSSPILCAAILTVAALNSADLSGALNTCYNEFLTQFINTTFDRYHTLDEIRALCIGAFWLSGLSWTLSGQAIRIATEIGLHLSMPKILRGATDQYERAQLWYLLYVCDHHFSIAYGRPPIIQDDAAIIHHQSFLQLPSICSGDTRIICQVSLFMILTKAYHRFGSDMESPVSEEDLSEIRVYNVEVDQWRVNWQPRLRESAIQSPRKLGSILTNHSQPTTKCAQATPQKA